ncbi:MAG: hypothetical protein B7C24_01745 [Bacteroidetes bacterium 4572_77]|nr:MAG: hypothetical protein B7C24_01745 [Bacteroidetes bacterium 4572_77]
MILNRLNKPLQIIMLLITAIGLSSCVSYSFTGASIPPEAKTISIQYFDNNASFIVPTLSESLTLDVKDRFSSQTSLILINKNGDLQIEGVITDFKTSPQAISGDEAASNRLSISVKVKFVNLIEPDKNYQTTFTRYEDYASSLNLADVQDELIKKINEMLVDDIFNKAVVNW